MRYIKIPFLILSESKKARALIVSLLLVLLTPIAEKIGYTLTADQLLYVVTLAASYMVGQGIADHGKEAAKVTAAKAE